MKIFCLTSFLICIIYIGCTKPYIIKSCEEPCRINLPCTYEFRSYYVQVLTKNATPVALDSFVVVRKYDKKLIINNYRAMDLGGSNTYLLFSDSEKGETTRCGEYFEFKAFKDKKQIASRTYNIAHDCCHISSVSGDTKIVLDE